MAGREKSVQWFPLYDFIEINKYTHTELMSPFEKHLYYYLGFEYYSYWIMEPVPPVTILGVEYPALADGQYDAVILGTGLKECIVAGLLATEGKKVTEFMCFYK